jgi:hypothetical protein
MDREGNSMANFSTLGASSHSKTERENLDYYATDPDAINFLFEMEEFEDKPIWEPACGGKHLSQRMEDLACEVYSSDIVNRGYECEILDFLKYDGPKFKGHIVTNPPYKYATEFVLKALESCTGKTAMFLKLQFLETIKRYEDLFSKQPPKIVYPFVRRMNVYKNGDFSNKQSSAVAYAWFVWCEDYDYTTRLKWIDNRL